MSDDRSRDAADWYGSLEQLRQSLPTIPEEHADWAASWIVRLLYRRFGEQRMSEAIAREKKKRLGRPKEDDQLFFEARRAPSARLRSLAQARSAWTRPSRPQSVPAMTFSRPTIWA